MQTNSRNTIFQILQTLFFILLISSSSVLHAQNISFKRLGLEEGLSELAGLCIEQDDLGRIWIGTRNGLNCWDGVRMKTFYPERGDTTTLMAHKINDLCVDRDYLWVRSAKGLSRLDLNTMTFKRFYIDNLLSLGKYKNTILAGSENGLLYLNTETQNFEPADYLFPYKIQIINIYSDKTETLWLASNQESKIIKISPKGTEQIPVPIEENSKINSMLLDPDNRLWISTRYNGILIYDNNNTFENITTKTSPFFLNDNSVRSLLEDKEGRIWAGTLKGISIFDFNKKTTTSIQASKSESNGLSHNSIYSLFLSNDNNLWIGTYFGGINYGQISKNVFHKYHENKGDAKPSYPVIGELIEDEKGNVWIATEGGGLDYFDRKKNTFTNYPASKNTYGLSHTNIKSLYLSNDKYLLAGTYQGGLNVIDLKTKAVKKYTYPEQDSYPNHVVEIIEYKGNYLLGTRRGISIFNHAKETFTPFFENEGLTKIHESVVALYIDSKGILWIGFEDYGLVSYNLETKKRKHYTFDEFDNSTIANNTIYSIVEDHRFRLWIGTDGGGLCMYKREADNFTTFNKLKHNLPSDFIYGISESRFGNLWIATSKGLSRFDVENNLFFNYTSESGFPLQELNYKSLLLTKSGELFVGGIDGLISFKERDLLMVNADMKIIFSNLIVNNKEVRTNDDSGILDKDISFAESFVLKPKHTVFSLNFSSFNFNNTLNNKFQYQLEGFNEEWVNSEFNTSATYTNLNPGKYTFKVRATDVAYNPITDEKTIEITIKPPLSRTWYAYSFYTLLFFGLILLFNNFYLGKVRLQYQLKNERTEKERIKELNQYKLRFFTNISHEFMSPLTIILSSLEHAFDKYKIPSKLKWQLNLALRNAKRLKNLNSELLDFRKIEQGHLKIRAQENNITPYLSDIHEAFEEIAAHKNITYELINTVENLPIFYDSAQMDKVFYNLLSNAFNHVPENTGKVSIELINNEKAIEIKVEDNGSGISKDDVKHVFKRFFQHDSSYTESAYQGSGIGLALTQSIVNEHKGTIKCQSVLNEGTTFSVTLLKGNSHFSETEISDKKRKNLFAIDKELIQSTKAILNQDIDEALLIDNNAPLLLIVDDNPDIRISVKNLFVDTYKILVANDGAEGLDKALENQPDIIISDVLMPKLSGLDMCKKLKANLNTSHIPVLLLTALDSEEDRTIAFKHGADSYCTKPFNSEMLKARIENLFQNRANLQQKFSSDPEATTKTVTQNIVDREFLRKACEIIEKNLLNNNFNVDEFAAEMNMGRTIFYSKVKTITGQTPNEYIQTIRLKKAADLLLNNTTKNVSEIAYDTGFNSPRYFAIAFKKHFGVNPSQYVKR